MSTLLPGEFAADVNANGTEFVESTEDNGLSPDQRVAVAGTGIGPGQLPHLVEEFVEGVQLHTTGEKRTKTRSGDIK